MVGRAGAGRRDRLGAAAAARTDRARRSARRRRRGHPLGRAGAAGHARPSRRAVERSRRSCSSASRDRSCSKRAGLGRAAAQPVGARRSRALRWAGARARRALGADELAPRIAQRAEGNPLFLEQLVAVDSGEGTGELPASIQAVLAARIDRLEPGERTLLRHAAVEGRTFHAGALAACCPSERARCRRAARPGPQGARRRRPARVRRRGRVSLHPRAHPRGRLRGHAEALRARAARERRRMAGAAASRGGRDRRLPPRAACGARTELGPPGQRDRALATEPRAAGAAPEAELGTGDAPVASGLLERAVALPPPTRRRGRAAAGLGATLIERAAWPTPSAPGRGGRAGTRGERVQAHAQVERQFLLLETETSVGIEQVGAGSPTMRWPCSTATTIITVEVPRVWSLRAQAAWLAGRVGRGRHNGSQAADCAERAGDERELFEARMGWRATASGVGPDPGRGTRSRRCEEFRERRRRQPGRGVRGCQPAGSCCMR